MKVIGIGGFARCGKDTFVAIAKDILSQNGYNPHRYAFADELKREVNDMMKAHGFQGDIYSNDTAVKTKNRPLLVWWGCTRRDESKGGLYWVDRLHDVLTKINTNLNQLEKDQFVALISDVRFLNEANWVQDTWNGYFVHLKRFKYHPIGYPIYDEAPNEEEAKNDPIICGRANYSLEWESREIPIGKSAVEDPYLREKVLIALNESPFFNDSLID